LHQKDFLKQGEKLFCCATADENGGFLGKGGSRSLSGDLF
jgi:hypothetical protein